LLGLRNECEHTMGDPRNNRAIQFAYTFDYQRSL
jgi:hypothetical protein